MAGWGWAGGAYIPDDDPRKKQPRLSSTMVHKIRTNREQLVNTDLRA